MATKKDLIMKGLGFGYMPDYMIEQEIKGKKLKEISIMKRVNVPMAMQRRAIDSMGPAKSFIWNNAVCI